MKVILLEEVRGKGGEGDVVDVARGFANNYLLRQGMAIKATPGNLKQLEQRRKNIAKREEVRINGAETRKGQLEAMTVVIATKVGDEGQLFGSVTAQMIADAIAEQNQGGVEVDRRRIDLRTPIKTVGEHQVEISLYREIKAVVKVKVVDEAMPVEESEGAESEDAPVEDAEGANDEVSELEDGIDEADSAEDGAEGASAPEGDGITEPSAEAEAAE